MKLFVFCSLLFFFSAAAEEVSFETVKIKVDKQEIKVRVADTDQKRSRGLMFVKSLPADEGMLFVFEGEQPLSFWMKNTLIPLSIGFFDDHGALVDMKEMKPAESLIVKTPPTYESKSPASFALEMNAGWFTKRHIGTGARLSLAGDTKSALLKRKLGSSGPLSRRSSLK